TSRLLAANSIQHDIAGNDIVVQPAPGQGAAFIFRETK
ncbi:VOC family protein, partial [Mesorhizobium sp. M7A.F.Ca.CA.002.04.1.1]